MSENPESLAFGGILEHGTAHLEIGNISVVFSFFPPVIAFVLGLSPLLFAALPLPFRALHLSPPLILLLDFLLH